MKTANPSADRHFFWIITAAMVVVAAGPYVFGLALTPPGYLFQGNTILAPGDPHVYFSYIEQARQGAWLMRDVFTAEPHPATLWQPVWLVLGWIANLFHLSTPAVFALGRLLSVVVFATTVWWAAGWIWPDSRSRRVAILLVLGGTGLGSVAATLGGMNYSLTLDLPPDLWVSEMVPLLSAWAAPHFLLVTSGFLFVMVAVERSWQTQSWRYLMAAGIVSLLTLSVHPFHVLTWLAVWLSITIWRWRTLKKFPTGYLARWAAVLLISVPAMTYYLTGLLTDPIVQGRAAQNINLTPVWWKVLSSIGGLGLLAALGVPRLRQSKNPHLAWMLIWAVVQTIVIFLPFTGQRRLMQAMLIPFALLAVPTVIALWQRWAGNRLRSIGLVVGLAVVLTGSTIITGGRIMYDYNQERQGRNHWEYFLSPDYQRLFAHVRAWPTADQPILASAWDSVLIAGFTGHPVVSGHPVETLRYREKNQALQRFFRSNDQREQADILRDYHACYVLDGPRERSYDGRWEPATWPNLQIAWSSQTLRLYRVTDCDRPE